MVKDLFQDVGACDCSQMLIVSLCLPFQSYGYNLLGMSGEPAMHNIYLHCLLTNSKFVER